MVSWFPKIEYGTSQNTKRVWYQPTYWKLTIVTACMLQRYPLRDLESILPFEFVFKLGSFEATLGHDEESSRNRKWIISKCLHNQNKLVN